MNPILARIFSAIAADAISLIPSQRINHVRKVVHETAELANHSAKQRTAIAEQIIAGFPEDKPKRIRPSRAKTIKGKKK